MRHLLRVCLLLLSGLVPAFARAGATADRPNIILINIDDLGSRELGAWGGRFRTPALDRMAAEGRRMTDHYAAPVCSPSRAALLTGCYPKRVLPSPHVLFPGAAVGLHPDEQTIAEVLRASGYATACIGKWHLGDQLPFLPLQQGFSEYFGLPYSNDMGPAAEGVKSNFGAPLPTPKAAPKAAGSAEDGTGIRTQQPPLPLLEGNSVIGRVGPAEQADLVRRYTERAVDYVQRPRTQPFFLYLAHNAVHFPLYPSAAFRARVPQSLLGAWIEEVDWSVGQVLDAVRTAGLERHTLVLFFSDNGGPLNHGADNHPLRGGKGSTLEGGIRVPLLAWWPGRIPAGTSSSAITANPDLLPTLAHLAGAGSPAGRRLDGVDISASLLGAASPGARREYLYFRGLDLEAVRADAWKLHLARGELYHLGEDPGEARDVAGQHPEIVSRLRAIAAANATDLGNTGVGPGCRPLGRIEAPQPLLAADGTVRADAIGPRPRFP